ETIKPGASIDLHLVADASGADFNELHSLNPALLRNITPGDASFQLKLPAGAAAHFEENIQQVPQAKWTSRRLHAIEDGDTLAGVAKNYHVTVSSLVAANHLEPNVQLPNGFLLNVPTVPGPAKAVRYRVERGDTLAGIADRFDVTVEELRRWNHLRGN